MSTLSSPAVSFNMTDVANKLLAGPRISIPAEMPADGHSFLAWADLQNAQQAADDSLRNDIMGARHLLPVGIPLNVQSVRGYRFAADGTLEWAAYIAVTIHLPERFVSGTGPTVDEAVAELLSKLA